MVRLRLSRAARQLQGGAAGPNRNPVVDLRWRGSTVGITPLGRSVKPPHFPGGRGGPPKIAGRIFASRYIHAPPNGTWGRPVERHTDHDTTRSI